LKKFLITKIGWSRKHKGVRVHKIDDPKYMDKVIDLLLGYTYKSVKNQTVKDFTWLFACGERTQSKHINRIKETVTDIPITFINKPINLLKAIQDHIKDKEFINFQVAADDYMHPKLLEFVGDKLMSLYDGNNIVVTGVSNGVIKKVNGSYIRFERPKIAIGHGVISNCGASILHDHTRLTQLLKRFHPRVPVIEEYFRADFIGWIYNRCELSLTLRYFNPPYGKLVSKEKVRKVFKQDF